MTGRLPLFYPCLLYTSNMIKSGKELKVFSIPQKDLKKFTEQAKRYGVLYCVLRDKNTKGENAPVDIIARDVYKRQPDTRLLFCQVP